MGTVGGRSKILQTMYTENGMKACGCAKITHQSLACIVILLDSYPPKKQYEKSARLSTTIPDIKCPQNGLSADNKRHGEGSTW